ncbi:MAG: ECF transporter S component [Lachnospiraceae bacterium]|nr:ECF transporter S component [Lachnospiraceae bacterium]
MNTLTQENKRVQKLTQAALCAALCYIGFTFFKIDIPVGTEKSAIHFGNIFCVLAALLTSGLYGGLAGAVGMTIADLTSGYATSAPKTFFLKLCIGLIVGVVAHRILKLNKEDHSARYIIGATFLSAAAGMAFNIVADPLVGYFYKTYLFGIPQDLSVTLAKIGAITTSINAVTATIISSILYLALRPVLKKCDLL